MKGVKVKKKPLGVLVQEYIKEEFVKYDASKQEFGNEFGIQPTTLHKLLHVDDPSFQTRVIDRILVKKNIDLQFLINRYGEYFDNK